MPPRAGRPHIPTGLQPRNAHDLKGYSAQETRAPAPWIAGEPDSRKQRPREEASRRSPANATQHSAVRLLFSIPPRFSAHGGSTRVVLLAPCSKELPI